jgi:hypothetical protein
MYIKAALQISTQLFLYALVKNKNHELTDLSFGGAYVKKSKNTLWTNECLITASLKKKKKGGEKQIWQNSHTKLGNYGCPKMI